MKLLGLTGGVGMGKSTAGALLAAMDVPIVDTDVLARQLVEPGQPALAEIKTRWGGEFIGPDGQLLRGRLAERVFSDAAAKRELEAILHPRIRQAWLTSAELWRNEGRALGVVVIPLLYETAAEAAFDAIVCVGCSAVTQSSRLQGRGWTAAQIAQRIAAQWPLEKKMALADFVIWSEGSVAVHEEQLKRIFAAIV